MKGGALAGALLVCWGGSALTGCGGPQSLGGDGDQCFRDDDCQAGLACIAPASAPKNRRCSSDPTPIVSMVEGPPPVQGGGAGTSAAGSGGADSGGSAAGSGGG